MGQPEAPLGVPTAAAGGRHWSSRLLHRVNEASSHSTTGLVVAALIIVWVLFGTLIGFPAWWQNVLYITGSTVTLIMVFAIQHTGSRQQSATQRKLDELLRSQPTADSRLIAVEEAPDGELEALADLNLADRIQAVNESN